MAETNYDSTVVGRPYVRVNHIEIEWPPMVKGGPLPSVKLTQARAIKTESGETIEYAFAMLLDDDLDLAEHGDDPIPLVDPATDKPLDGKTSLNQALLIITSIARSIQKRHNP